MAVAVLLRFLHVELERVLCLLFGFLHGFLGFFHRAARLVQSVLADVVMVSLVMGLVVGLVVVLVAEDDGPGWRCRVMRRVTFKAMQSFTLLASINRMHVTEGMLNGTAAHLRVVREHALHCLLHLAAEQMPVVEGLASFIELLGAGCSKLLRGFHLLDRLLVRLLECLDAGLLLGSLLGELLHLFGLLQGLLGLLERLFLRLLMLLRDLFRHRDRFLE